jgi:hypothetical protein
VAAVAAVAALAVPFSAPAGAADLPCIDVEIDGRHVTLCEDVVTITPCPFPQNGFLVDVGGKVINLCFVIS